LLVTSTGTHSIKTISDKTAIPYEIATAVVDACVQSGLIVLNADNRTPLSSVRFCALLGERYTLHNTTMFTQTLWKFISSGKADSAVLDGWLLEGYHFIRGAAARLAYAASMCDDEMIRAYFITHHLEEYDHYRFFEDALRRRGINLEGSMPLPSTEAIINCARMAARRGPLHYVACSGLLEFSGSDTERSKELYRTIANHYDAAGTGFTEPLLAHALLDREYGHGAICEQILSTLGSIDLVSVNFILDTVDIFAETITYWFNDIYRSYVSGAGKSREYYRATGVGFK
jgi:hypothetical protein